MALYPYADFWTLPTMSKAYLIAVVGFLMWGNIPLYFSPLSYIPLPHLVGFRVITGMFFLLFLLFLQKKLRTLIKSISIKNIAWIFLSSNLLMLNWGTYLYAVQTEQLIQASLGYFIGPLISVVLGWFWFKEHKNPSKILAILLAFCGVLSMSYHAGQIPWLGLILGGSLSIYGALHKRYIKRSSIDSMTLETCCMFPIIVAILLLNRESYAFQDYLKLPWVHIILLMGCGIMTVLPLMCYSFASKSVSFVNLGLLSYISPSIQMMNAILWFHEPMDIQRWISFSLIWLGLLLYIMDQLYLEKYGL